MGSPLFKLLGEFDDTCLADDGHFDLARILQFALNALGDIAGEDLGTAVVDRVGLDDDADLATCLNGKGLLDTFEGVGDSLQLLESLDVSRQGLPSSARSGRRNGAARHRL